MRWSRNLGATALTVAVLAAGLVVALRDRLPARGEDASDPSDVFWEMIDVSREGAADAWLDLFAGEEPNWASPALFYEKTERIEAWPRGEGSG